jgi:hypothetical protein
MVGTAREAEFLLRVALLASQFRPWVQNYGMPASQRDILHHQYQHRSVARLCGVFIFTGDILTFILGYRDGAA